jgi:hypothetical protein
LNGKPVNRLNFQTLERLDVITGLLDYAGVGEMHRQRFRSLYERSASKPFGEALDIGRLKEERCQLLDELQLGDEP